MIRILVLLFLLPLSSVCVQAQSSGDAEKGEVIYYEYACYSCHGYNGTGRTLLLEGASGIITNEDVFIMYLRQRAELNPLLPANTMPNYDAATLSDEQARDLYAYIKTFKDDPPEVKDDPLMQGIIRAAKEAAPP